MYSFSNLDKISKNSLLSATLALTTALTVHAQTGNNIETSCDWAAPPTVGPVNCTPWTTIPGNLWDTKWRTCSQVTSGTKICVTHEVNWVCSGGGGFRIGRDPMLGGGGTYTKNLGREISRTMQNVTETRRWQRSGCVWVGTTPLGTLVTHERVQAKVSQNMTNLWDDFPVQSGHFAPPTVIAPTTVTFEGTVIPHGADIVLADYGPGTYDYYATRRLNGVVDSIHFIIEVEQDHDLQPRTMVPSERHDHGIPVASAEYTNNSIDPISVIGVIGGSLLNGLDAAVISPVQKVFPGQTVTVDIDFTTQPGWVLTHGVPLQATLELRETNGGATPLPSAPLASVVLDAGSISGLVGSGEDFQLGSMTASSYDRFLPVKGASLTDVVHLTHESVGQTFLASDYNALFADVVDYQNLPAPVPMLPGYRLGPAPIEIGNNLMMQGAAVDLPLAAGFIGLMIRFQGMVASPNTANGVFAFSDAHDVVVQN